jgi:hypothetical protein
MAQAPLRAPAFPGKGNGRVAEFPTAAGPTWGLGYLPPATRTR